MFVSVLFCRRTYPDCHLGQFLDSVWPSKAACVDSRAQPTDAVSPFLVSDSNPSRTANAPCSFAPCLSDALSVKTGAWGGFSDFLSPHSASSMNRMYAPPTHTHTQTYTPLCISYDLGKQGERLFCTIEQMRLFSETGQRQCLVLSFQITFRIADCMLFRLSYIRKTYCG